MDRSVAAVRLVVTGKGSSLNAVLCALLVAAAALLVTGVLVSSPAQAQGCSARFALAVPTDVAVTAVPIVVASTTADYFVLYATHGVGGRAVEYPVAVVLGRDGTTTLSENVAALPLERYRVEKYSIDSPADVDGDCIDDLTELADLANMNPVNPAENLHLPDRFAVIADHQAYETLAYVSPDGGSHVKYVIADLGTDRPSVYFQDTKRTRSHTLLSERGDATLRGTISYDPDFVAPDGSRGVYLNSVIGRPSLHQWERVHTLLAASMPVLDDNLGLRIVNQDLPQIQADLQSGQTFRANLVFDEDVYGGTGFLALNPGEGYGLLRNLEADERPHSRDVVIYETLPNELPRVAGIISTVPQTPLSHVNLRALQDGVPNAFIADALENADISDLIDRHVHYAVSDTAFAIRAATQAEVDEFHASSRPAEAQTPQRDLTATSITPLSEIGFEDWDAFGVKAANVAVLGTLGFPAGVAPDGFAVPFHFYDEFMKHNDLYEYVREMLADSDFQTDFDTRVDELKKLRKKIKKAETPAWIETALTTIHATFGEEASLRYRSSTNNEDLPGFNGAGLYDSKTQHPDETTEDGISKSLKQVYASLWNYRAFAERDFHRIDHLATAMGVLVHPNYSDEPVNGVAVSVDPAYGTEGTHYVNSQLGEDLVTNPEAHSEPEELLLNPDGTYTVVALSNQVPPAQLLMTDDQLAQLRRHLSRIHEKFADLYTVEEGEQFAMEIEFKITSDNVLAIKQARPWIFAGPPPDIDTEDDALTAAFENAPATHDGTPFTLRIRFNENIDIGFNEFRDYTLAVTGGRVREVIRVNSRSDHWEIEVAPDSPHEDVTVVVAHNRHCLVVGAICTDDGRRLSNRLELTVQFAPPGVPHRPTATALWSGIVDLEWNDDARAASYDVQFSLAPEGSSQPDLWDDLPDSGIDIAFYGAGAIVKNLPPETLRFRVRAVNPQGASDWSEDVAVPSTGEPEAWTDVPEPVNSPATGTPRIQGVPTIGVSLRVKDYYIADENGLERVKFHYQWTRSDGVDETDIEGATGTLYTVTEDDVAKTIRVRVSFVDRGGFEESRSSRPDSGVVNTPPAGRPTITGTPGVTETLVADTADITDENGLGSGGFRYQWIRTDRTGDSEIGGATDPIYTLTWDDIGKTVKVRVNFTDGDGYWERLTSAATKAVETPVAEVALEGELTAGRVGYMLPALTGYSIFGNLGGTLTPDQFVFEGNTYRVLILFHASEGLWLAMSRDLPVDLTLRVGDATYHASESKIPAVNTGTRAFWWPMAPPDWLGDAPVAVSLTLHPEIPLGDRPKAPVAGYFTGIPTDHDGAEDISFRVYFSEGVATTADALRDHVLAVSGGAVSRVDAVDSEGRIWAITVSPGVWAPITIRIAANRNCNLPEAICTGDGRRLFNAMELVVPTKPNHPPTGAPTISGEVEVGKTLTVDTSGISDADGLTAATFTYQWISVGTVRDRDIPGTTGPTYTPVPADARTAIKVKVSFTDDVGKTESLTSPARTERPRTLTAANSGGAVVLTWELPERWGYTNSYYILRSRPEVGETAPLVRLTHVTRGQTTYTDTNTEPGVLYAYRVRGANPFGEPRDASEPVAIRTPQPDPATNNPATGAPTIDGEPHVGEALTAGTSGIADADGMSGAVFTYQWLADDTDIADATRSNYTPTGADENKTLKVRVAFTDDEGNAETLTSAATAAISAATTELTAEFRDIPTLHDGQSPFTVELRFSEEFEVLYADLRDDAFTVTAGTVTAVRRLDRPHNIRWEITVQPDSDADVTILLPATQDCDDPGALCTADARMLSADVTVTITGPAANSPATGAPTIDGEPHVGEALTAGTSGIADADGMSGAVFTYQWLADDTDIADATRSNYTPTGADENKTLKVRVAFTDDEGNAETLTSAATATISAATTELTAEFWDIPTLHDGQSPFTVELRFTIAP